MVTISVHSRSMSVAAETTVSALLDEMGLGSRKVAVERNGEIVPRSRHHLVEVKEGDQFEVVVAVGGG